MTASTNLINQRFSKLTVLERVENNKNYRTQWLCKCDCGNTKVILGASLTQGKTKSCGCYSAQYVRDAQSAQAKTRNGLYIESDDVWYGRAATIRYSCRKNNIPFGFDSNMEFALHIKEIAPENCPVFNQPLLLKGGGFSPYSPSVDKIIPSKGYVRGNLQIISYLANSMKRDASIEQLIQFAHWVLRTFTKESVNA